MAAPAAKLALEGNNWKVENQNGKNDIVVDVKDYKQSVHLYKCTNSVITIKGKVTSISIDACKKSGVIFDNVIASASVVNGEKVQLQCNGAIPNITIDKSSGVTIYVQTAAGRSVEIVTSAATEINVVTPGKTENDDPLEQSIPHQFLTVFGADGKLITKPTEHVGV